MGAFTKMTSDEEVAVQILKFFRILNYDLFESLKDDKNKINQLNEIFSSFSEITMLKKLTSLFEKLRTQELIPVVIICDEHNEYWKIQEILRNSLSILNIFRNWTGPTSGVSRIKLNQ